jgi:hypothetical protein
MAIACCGRPNSVTSVISPSRSHIDLGSLRDLSGRCCATTRSYGEALSYDPSPKLRHLRCHLRIPHSLLAVKTLDHFDRGSHVGRKLKHANALRNPHGGVGVPERVGDALPSIGPAKYSRLVEGPLKPLLETSDGSTVRMQLRRQGVAVLLVHHAGTNGPSTWHISS